MFTDKVILELVAGDGGNGIISWRREKYIPKGGPSGGNGGDGGSVILQVDPNLLSLDKFRKFRRMRAEKGRQGGPNLSRGKRGRDLVLSVPPGTIVKETKSGNIIVDLTASDDKLVICKGGKGGRGNASFKSPTNRAPNIATPGKPGETKFIEMELKIIADIGLVGFPNAGKSTLFAAITKAGAKIGNYPFTTLHPNIGYIETRDYRRLFIADIPGIMEKAHEGKGLGSDFLRHIERTRLLIYVLDAGGVDGRDPLNDYAVLLEELSSHNPKLLKMPYLLILNKTDCPNAKKNIALFKKRWQLEEHRIFELSALNGRGIADLVAELRDFDPRQ